MSVGHQPDRPLAPPLPLEVSLYLDAVRFLAAMVVFMGHFGLQRLSGGFLWQLNPLGPEAVAVFFVLSGFVIAYAVDSRERSVRAYAISRLARLASVVLPALLLTAVLDEAGSALRPDLYSAAAWGYQHDMSWLRWLSALTFTHEAWGLQVSQGSNAAYWSLGYEVPYYLMFGLAVFLRGRARWAALAVALLAYGPAIAAALPVWLTGVAVYGLSRRQLLSARAGIALSVLSLLAWVGYEITVWTTGRPLLSDPGWFKRPALLQDVIIGVCFGIHLLGFCAAAPTLGTWLRHCAKPVRWLAGATFTLYLCHLPLAQFLLACAPWPRSDWRTRLMVFVGTLVLVFLIAQFTERHKHIWKRLFASLSPVAIRARRRGKTSTQ